MKIGEMRGLGDLVEALLGFLRIVSHNECDCQHRREQLNKMFPFPSRHR